MNEPTDSPSSVSVSLAPEKNEDDTRVGGQPDTNVHQTAVIADVVKELRAYANAPQDSRWRLRLDGWADRLASRLPQEGK